MQSRNGTWISRTVSLCALLLCAAGTASADTISYNASFGPTQTNWGMGTGTYPSINLSVPQFDPLTGHLTQVTVTLHSQATGMAKFESRDSKASTVTTNLQAKVVIKRPDGSDFIAVIPLASASAVVTAYDNVMDFGGTSGRTYANLVGDKSDSRTLISGSSDFQMFMGSGSVSMPTTAQGMSAATGSGNMVTSFKTMAEADITVTYTFTPVPLPQAAAGGLLLTGMLAVSRMRKRKAI